MLDVQRNNNRVIVDYDSPIPSISAICKSGLMFDGQLIIDTELRTNDPSIFAAGTITKYCRRYYSEIWQHVHFNSIEIGEKVSRNFSCIGKITSHELFRWNRHVEHSDNILTLNHYFIKLNRYLILYEDLFLLYEIEFY